MKKVLLTALSAVALTFAAQADDKYVPLTDARQLANGAECIIVNVNEGAYIAMGKMTNTSATYQDKVDLSADNVDAAGAITPPENVQIVTVKPFETVEGTVHYTISGINSNDNKTYYYFGGQGSNNFKIGASAPTELGDRTWEITVDATNGTTGILCDKRKNSTGTADMAYVLQYNAANPRFTCYKTANQKPVTLYVKQTGAPTFTAQPTFEGFAGNTGTWWNATTVKLGLEEGAQAWYTLDGNEPTTESTPYDPATGIAIPAATTDGQVCVVKAIARKGELELSSVATLTLTAAKEYTFVRTAAVLPGIPYRLVVNAGTDETPDYRVSTATGSTYYIQSEKIDLTDGKFESTANNVIKFTATATEGQYLMQQANGEYLYMSGNYFSFSHTAQAPATDAEDYARYLWTVTEQADGTVKIANVGRTYTVDEQTAGLFVMYSKQYNNFTVYNPDKEAELLPMLYAPQEMLPVDFSLAFPDAADATVKALAFTTIDGAVVNAPGFEGNINYTVTTDADAEVSAEDYSLMIADGKLNVMFRKAGTYLLTATTEATDIYPAGKAVKKFIVEKIATTISFKAESYTGVVNVTITTLDKAVVTPDNYDGTVTFELSGEGLTPDDYSFDLSGKYPKLTVKKAGTWTMTATAPATDAFDSSSTTATVIVTAAEPVVPAEPVAKIGDTVLTTESVFQSETTVEVTLSCETEGAKVFYLLTETPDQPAPAEDAEYTEYTAPFSVAKSGTLSVYSELNGVKSEAKAYSIEIKTDHVGMTIADMADAEVYSLQGYRVARPEAGKLYIIRAAGRTFKAILK